jgi:DNA phosphorothioation-associated putative methyltransferase
VLVVAARLKEESKGTSLEAYEDGGLTKVGTFQKFYDQSELREWINQALGVGCVAAAPGVFYVFREEAECEGFLATRYRRFAAAPKLRRSDVLFEQHRAVLEALMAFFAERGRLPADDELADSGALRETFGSIRQAFRVVLRVTGEDQWEGFKLERAEDMLVYLGLSRFERRPRMSQLPRPLQLDVKAFFGNYTKACDQADELLFSLGNRDLVAAALTGSPVGKGTLNGLYVHVSALHELPSLLRLFEGCARSYIGAVEGATLVKLHRAQPVVSYLRSSDVPSSAPRVRFLHQPSRPSPQRVVRLTNVSPA